MANPYRAEIIQLVKQSPQRYSYQDVADLINQRVGQEVLNFNSVRGVARNNNVTGFFSKNPGVVVMV